MKKKIWIPIIAGLVMALAMAGILFFSKSSKKPEVYKIASILPLTGSLASLGEQMKNGQELAAELINQNQFQTQHKKIQIIFEDGKGTAKDSVTAFNKARLNGVSFFITTLSPVALSILPLAKKEDILLFADAAHPSISGSGKYIFRHSSTADQEAEIITEYINQNLAVKSVAVLVANDDYGKSFQSQFVKLFKNSGKIITQSLEYEKSEKDFRPLVLKLISDKPDSIMVVGAGAPLGIIIKRLRELNYKGEIIANNGFNIPEAKKFAGDAGKGVHYIVFDFNIDNPEFQRINDSYKTRYGEEMSAYSIIEFNTVLLLTDAINRNEGNVHRVAKYLQNLKEYKGLAEYMIILSSGDIIPKLKVIKHQ